MDGKPGFIETENGFIDGVKPGSVGGGPSGG